MTTDHHGSPDAVASPDRAPLPLSPSARMRKDLVLELLAPIPHGAELLEIGIGAGAMAAELSRRWNVTGVDPSAAAVDLARRRFAAEDLSVKVVRGSVSDLPPQQLFDGLCAFEVLEHQPDDLAILREWRQRLRPSGVVILSVPAHPERFGPSDEFAGHVRRYSRESLSRALSDAGFQCDVIWCYGFPLLNVLERIRHAVAKRKLDRVAPGASAEERSLQSGYALQPPPWLTKTLAPVVAVSARLQKAFVKSDWGIGFVARARRSR